MLVECAIYTQVRYFRSHTVDILLERRHPASDRTHVLGWDHQREACLLLARADVHHLWANNVRDFQRVEVRAQFRNAGAPFRRGALIAPDAEVTVGIKPHVILGIQSANQLALRCTLLRGVCHGLHVRGGIAGAAWWRVPVPSRVGLVIPAIFSVPFLTAGPQHDRHYAVGFSPTGSTEPLVLVVSGSCDAEHVIERAVDFQRHRSMRCGSCRHEWSATSEWLNRFDQAVESCPSCGTDCQSDHRPTFCAAQDDPAHADSYVRDVHWYHTSTHPTWPDKDFNPAAGLTEVTKLRFRAGGSGNAGLERWVEQQKAKALHIGTYESAIENMFRRMRYQAGSAEQFYLYRVRLSPDFYVSGHAKLPIGGHGTAH